MHANPGDLFSRMGIRRSVLSRTVAAGLVCAIVAGPLSRPARAATPERRMETLTKSTIYGALLGGLLGLTSALVVKDSARDDVIRWGIAIGAFSGFAYGIFSIGHGSEDSSKGPDATPPITPDMSEARPASRDSVRAGSADLIRCRRLGERYFVRSPEVSHDGFEKEDSQVEEAGARQRAEDREGVRDIASSDRGAPGLGPLDVVIR